MNNRNKIFNLIFSLLFLGVILSISLITSMTSMMRPEENISDDYFNGQENISESSFWRYDNAYLKNKLFHSLIVNTEYRLFGNVKQGNVISGKRNFLFQIGRNEYGYDYVTDYFGGYNLSDENLEKLYEIISTRRAVFENQGRHYILAVIPNSQTIYSEYMPAYFGEISDNTVLSQITSYMTERGETGYLDLTEAMHNASDDGLLYNNTENSINALGAYFVYNTVMDRLSESLPLSDRLLDRSEFKYHTHYTDGKSAAIEAGLESIIQNITVSMSNSTEFKYTVVDYSGELVTTYVKSSYRAQVPLNPYVLIECSDEWDKIQLMPYFSNTFGVSSYKVGHIYDAETVEQTNPLIVVQTIHEHELISLLNEETHLSYKNALGDSKTPYKTRTPQQLTYTMLDDKSVCISGVIENDAEIHIFGDGFKPLTARGIDGRFFVRLSFANKNENHEVFLNAKSPDKASSDLVTLFISDNGNMGSLRDVVIGSDSMLYKMDYGVPLELPDKATLNEFGDYMHHVINTFSQSNITLDTKVMFALVPEKLSVYTEGLPTDLLAQHNRRYIIKRTFSDLLIKAGGYYVDLTSPLVEKTDEKLFYQTDDTVSDIAYYYMYCEIIKSISQYESGMTPKPADSLFEYSVPHTNGEFTSALGFDMSKITEVVTKIRFPGSHSYQHNPDGSFISYKTDVTLPRAVIVYDDSGAPLVDMLADHFSVMFVMKKDESYIPDSVLEQIKPDYVIYLCNENSIDFIMKY